MERLTWLAAAIAPSIRSRSCSILARFQGSLAASTLAMKRGVLSITTSRISRSLLRRLAPESVMSRMASASSGGFTSVAPHENSIDAETPAASKCLSAKPTASLAIRLPSRS